MEVYNATLNRVIDGDCIDLNVDIGDSQIEVKRIRLQGVKTGKLNKVFHKSFKGGAHYIAMLEIKKWFYEKSPNLTVETETKEICGRWLGVIKAEGEATSLNDYLINKGYSDTRWGKDNQEELIDDWFAGEEVTVPDGDTLPIFHAWGKPVFLGPESINLKWLQ